MKDSICPDCGAEMTYSYVTLSFTCFDCIARLEEAFLAEYDLLEDDDDFSDNEDDPEDEYGNTVYFGLED